MSEYAVEVLPVFATRVVQVMPPSDEVAKPMAAPPPEKILPTWNAVTMVAPKDAALGSTSVACWLCVFVKLSALSFSTPLN